MLEKDTNINSQVSERVYKTPKSVWLLNRPAWLGFLAFIILSLLFTLLIFQRYQLANEAREKEAYKIVNQAKQKLQEALTHSLAATKTLTFLIDKNGVVNNFDSVAGQILELGRDIDAIQLVPEGVIKYVYPLPGNEKVIGYNVLKDPARNKEAFKAIDVIEDHHLQLFQEIPGLDRSILAKAFRGELVPQDPNDEPAAVLLDRIRAEREQTSTPKQRGKITRKNSSKQLSIEGIE